MDTRALETYHETQIHTGSPVRLVAMLYDGALRFLNQAREAIERGDIPTRADRIRRVLHIVQELGNALDHQVESDLPQRLAALYDYVEYELLEASRRNSTVPLDNAEGVLRNLAEAWRDLAERNVEAAAPAPVEPASEDSTSQTRSHAPSEDPSPETSPERSPEDVSLCVSA